jgi:uncharacterized protein (DUF433 family)
MIKSTERDLYRGRNPRELPAYDAFDASRYLRIPENTIRAWLFGRRYPKRTGGSGWTRPLIDVADSDRHLLSFVNLVELHVLDAMRRHHQLEMSKIKKTIEYMKEKFGTPRPLVDEVMETDGKHVFVNKYGSLVNVSQDGQLAMEALIEAHLRRIERDERGIAVRLFPFTRRVESVNAEAPRIIAIDPAIAFGRPVISGSRVPTVEVAERFKAGESPRELAEDFGRKEDEILEAIRCELEAA